MAHTHSAMQPVLSLSGNDTENTGIFNTGYPASGRIMSNAHMHIVYTYHIILIIYNRLNSSFRFPTRLLVCSFTCLLFAFTAKAQDSSLVFGSKVFFFQTDSVQLKRGFRTNRSVFDALDFLLDRPEVYHHIDSVLVVGAASPAGTAEHNRSLSVARARAMEVYIMWKHPGFDRSRIGETAAGIDWDGFQYLVSEDALAPDRGKILFLLGRTRNEELLLRELRSLPPATQNTSGRIFSAVCSMSASAF